MASSCANGLTGITSDFQLFFIGYFDNTWPCLIFAAETNNAMSEITNGGKKGFCLLYGILFFLGFLVTVFYLYYANFRFI